MANLSAMGLKILHNTVSFWEAVRRVGVNGGGSQETFWKLDIGLDWVGLLLVICFALFL
jgi:hypothetical protein